MVQRFFKVLRLGIFAGALIGIGGAVNLQLSSMGYPALGAIFFSFGLMCVCILGANLFTGKVGYVLENDRNYFIDVLIMALGNIIGALVVGYICGALFPNWNVSLTTKFLYGEGATWYGCALRAIGAGVFVYLAVECFKRIENYPAKLVMVCLSIATMVLLGCNHSIANVFYFAYAQVRVAGFDWANAIWSVIVAMLGNSIGSLLIYLLQRSIPRLKD
ncbi:MAG: formate/nitrite transporter family protein [Bacilli bacterium]|nr:formate/nitrite transporter family protein [Bacilli bacterium]